MIVVVLTLVLCYHTTVDAGESLPVGHMQPLGGHRPPDTVEERYDFPSAEEFLEQYVRKSKHVVFRGAAKQSSAFQLWTEEYLKEHYPTVELRLEAKKEKQGFVPVGAAGVGRDTMEHFIDVYHSTNRYIVSELPTSMWQDVSVLPCMSCGVIKDRIVEVDLWMSGGDSSSIVHKDAFNTMNCLLNGTKHWKFIDYSHEDKIYKAWEPDNQIGGFSRINPEAVDLLKYPLMQEVPWSYAKLEAGDCVFLPGSMYHQVKSFGSTNVAVALLFSRFKLAADSEINGTDFKDCNPETQKFTLLSEFDVDWQYPGNGTMTMGNSELKSFLEWIHVLTYKGQISMKRIKKHVDQMYANRVEQYRWQRAKVIYRTLYNISKSKHIDVQDISRLSKVDLRKLGIALMPEEPSNTYDYEYSYVNAAEIEQIVKKLVTVNEKLIKEEFIAEYQQSCGGTEKFANIIFDALRGSNEKSELTKEEVLTTLKVAIAPFDEDRSTDFYRDDERFSFGDAYEKAEAPRKSSAMSDEEWDNIGAEQPEDLTEDDVYLSKDVNDLPNDDDDDDMPAVEKAKDEL